MPLNHLPHHEFHSLDRRQLICGSAAGLAAGSMLSGGASTGISTAPAAPLESVSPTGSPPKAKSVIQIFLWGGMSHNDTWDPKPEAGRAYTGDFGDVISTNVPGIQLNALFPQLARQADKYSLIRSMTHGINGHETAAYLMQTGHSAGERLAYPSVGAVFSLFKKDTYQGMLPPYIVLTKAAGRFSEEGFLGPNYKPFATGGNPNSPRFEVEGIVSKMVNDQRQTARRALLDGLNTMGKSSGDDPLIAEAEESKARAYDLILGAGREVFDLSKEKEQLRDQYGRHTFGQECLVARRLVEAGVPYIVINYPGGWDTHKNHFQTMRKQVPELDQGLAALLADLQDRGLLDSTVVWCSGEFGRGPKVDYQPPWNGGRNHYGDVFSVLIAGGGFRGGHVVGASDSNGEQVIDRPVYPVDLLGSIYTLGGINPAARLPHPLGLDAFVLPMNTKETKSAGLLKEIMS